MTDGSGGDQLTACQFPQLLSIDPARVRVSVEDTPGRARAADRDAIPSSGHRGLTCSIVALRSVRSSAVAVTGCDQTIASVDALRRWISVGLNRPRAVGRVE